MQDLAPKLMQQGYDIKYMLIELDVDYVATKRKAQCPSQSAGKPCSVSGYRISKQSPICLPALSKSTGESAGEKPACAASTAVQTDVLASKHLCLQPVRQETWHWSVKASGIPSLLAILLQRQLYPVEGERIGVIISLDVTARFVTACLSKPLDFS